MEKNTESRSFKYKINRKNRKTIGIKVTLKGEVIITSPFGVSEETIENIVRKKESWILGKISMIQNTHMQESSILNKEYKVLYLGREFELELDYERNHDKGFYVINKKLNIPLKNAINLKESLTENMVKNYVINMYKKQAEKILIERTKIYSEIIGVYPYKITIKGQNTIWGSCSSKKNINYNYRIIMAPIAVVDYIVVHELCHLVYMNHSNTYWNKVSSILPDYKFRRQWLKDNGYRLMKAF